MCPLKPFIKKKKKETFSHAPWSFHSSNCELSQGLFSRVLADLSWPTANPFQAPIREGGEKRKSYIIVVRSSINKEIPPNRLIKKRKEKKRKRLTAWDLRLEFSFTHRQQTTRDTLAHTHAHRYPASASPGHLWWIWWIKSDIRIVKVRNSRLTRKKKLISDCLGM